MFTFVSLSSLVWQSFDKFFRVIFGTYRGIDLDFGFRMHITKKIDAVSSNLIKIVTKYISFYFLMLD